MTLCYVTSQTKAATSTLYFMYSNNKAFTRKHKLETLLLIRVKNSWHVPERIRPNPGFNTYFEGCEERRLYSLMLKMMASVWQPFGFNLQH
jgi:hypothetical protein